MANERVESVADFCEKPLVKIDAGDLGTSTESVEKGISDIFHLAEKWHAVLLLDEADVFLEQRQTSDLNRNSLVSGIDQSLYNFKTI